MAQKELKTEKISVKLTMSEKFAISRYAKASGVSVSSYMVMKAMQKDGLTPALLVKIQNLLNVAIKVIDESDPYMVDYLKRRCMNYGSSYLKKEYRWWD